MATVGSTAAAEAASTTGAEGGRAPGAESASTTDAEAGLAMSADGGSTTRAEDGSTATGRRAKATGEIVSVPSFKTGGAVDVGLDRLKKSRSTSGTRKSRTACRPLAR